jgi:hypothetical protein
MLVRGKHRIEDVFDGLLADDEREPLEQQLPGDCEGRQVECTGQGQVAVAEKRERQPQPRGRPRAGSPDPASRGRRLRHPPREARRRDRGKRTIPACTHVHRGSGSSPALAGPHLDGRCGGRRTGLVSAPLPAQRRPARPVRWSLGVRLPAWPCEGDGTRRHRPPAQEGRSGACMDRASLRAV